MNVVQAMLTDKEIRQYFDEAVTQTVAGSIAEAFNHLATDRGLCVAVKMLPVSVVSLPQLVAHWNMHMLTPAQRERERGRERERERERERKRARERERWMHARTYVRTHCSLAIEVQAEVSPHKLVFRCNMTPWYLFSGVKVES